MIRLILRFIAENKFWFELVSLVISGILAWLIIFLVAKTSIIGEEKEYFFDILGKAKLSKRRTVKAWKQILGRFNKGDEANMKLAIIESDKVLDELLKLSGYKGETMADRLKTLTPAQMPNIEEIWQAHKIRNRIVHEPNFKLDRGEAWMCVEIYKKSFQEFGLID